MTGKESVYIARRTIQHDVDVIVARSPGIPQKLLHAEFIELCEIIAQPVHCLPQRLPPMLAPGAASAGVTAAIVLPAFHPMHATPRAFLDDFHFMRWRVLGKVFAV